MENYSLEVISHHPDFKNRSLRKYNVDGIDTVGAWGNEPFEIKFTNHTWNKVQIKLSLDGTDILTGEPATTEVSNKMWFVKPYGSLCIQAWPESNNGGARFVFTNAQNSVALNTHGDMSSRGIIAAAVYVEGQAEPIRIDYHQHYHWNSGGNYSPHYFGGDGTYASNSIPVPASDTRSRRGLTKCSSKIKCQNLDLSENISENMDCDLEKSASVGAGEYVNQKLSYVEGLKKPVFAGAIRVKYIWWDDLKAKLEAQNKAEAQPTGFPGDKNDTFIKLGNTPRVESAATKKGFIKRIVSNETITRF